MLVTFLPSEEGADSPAPPTSSPVQGSHVFTSSVLSPQRHLCLKNMHQWKENCSLLITKCSRSLTTVLGMESPRASGRGVCMGWQGRQAGPLTLISPCWRLSFQFQLNSCSHEAFSSSEISFWRADSPRWTHTLGYWWTKMSSFSPVGLLFTARCPCPPNTESFDPQHEFMWKRMFWGGVIVSTPFFFLLRIKLRQFHGSPRPPRW